MTKGNRAIATKLRELARDRNDYDIGPSLEVLADTIDPPKPEPGTVVWCRYINNKTWQLVFVVEGGDAYNQFGVDIDLDECEWKCARILGPRQVAVDVPPMSDWGHNTVALTANYEYSNGFSSYYCTIITREEAERLEAKVRRCLT